MIRAFASVLLATLFLAEPFAVGVGSNAAAVTADEVARRVQDRDTGRDSRSTMRMKLSDRHDRARERALTLLTLRGRGDPARPARAGRRPPADPLHLPERHPAAPASWSGSTRNADDERFLFLPSLGRVRRIAGSETQESFVGSDFTYEDIGGREFDDYTYALRATRTRRGRRRAARRVRPGGSNRGARTPSAEFPRVVSLVLKDSFVVVAGRHLQPAQREAEGLHGPPARTGRGHLDGDGRRR